MSGLSISASGMNDGLLRMQAASSNVAVMNVEGPVDLTEVSSAAAPEGRGVVSQIATRESVFGTDLISELVNMKLAETAIQANAKAAEAASSVLGTLVDMTDSGE